VNLYRTVSLFILIWNCICPAFIFVCRYSDGNNELQTVITKCFGMSEHTVALRITYVSTQTQEITIFTQIWMPPQKKLRTICPLLFTLCLENCTKDWFPLNLILMKYIEELHMDGNDDIQTTLHTKRKIKTTFLKTFLGKRKWNMNTTSSQIRRLSTRYNTFRIEIDVRKSTVTKCIFDLTL